MNQYVGTIEVIRVCMPRSQLCQHPQEVDCCNFTVLEAYHFLTNILDLVSTMAYHV